MAVRLTRTPFKYINNLRTIMSGNVNLNQVKDDLEKNPYYKKYANKIQHLQKADPEEFLRKLRECHEKKNVSQTTKSKQVVYGDKKPPISTLNKKPRALDDIMKTSLLENKTKEEIIEIWTEFHKSKELVYGSLASDVYDRVSERSTKYPCFLLPLPRDEGYEFIVLQCEGNEVHFTPLISYQTHKADAPECLTLVYYPELSATKGLVLMKGEFDKNILSPLEAQCLVNTLHMYYGEDDQKRTNLLDTFNYNPDNFRYMDLVAEMDGIPLKG